MFPRPALYHPYKRPTPFSPVGFRIVDYINPKRCFNLFQGHHVTDTRSPTPGLGLHHPKDDAPPTISLSDFLPRPSTPTPDHARNAMLDAVRPNISVMNPLPNPPCHKGRHGPKHLSFYPPHRRAQQLRDKRNLVRRRILDCYQRRVVWARERLSSLRAQAESLMTSEHMTVEDRIFLKQLAKLHMDQVWQYGLDEQRQQLWRAADESEEKRLAHEKRDAEVAKMRKRRDEEARKEQRRRVAEYLRERQEARKARHRRREDAALRADMARQRVHEIQERQVREKQERLLREELARKAKEENDRRQRDEEAERVRLDTRARFVREARDRILREEQERREREEQVRQAREKQERRAREEQERKAREERERQAREEQERREMEERERQAREEQERRAREEREHQARILAEQARRAAQEEQIRQHFMAYEAKWNELRTNNSLGPIDIQEIPWPVFGAVSSADQITYQDVRAFLFHPQRPGVQGKTGRDKVRSEVLRFHPDKFNTRIALKIQPSQRVVAQEISGTVARILTRILTEEEEKQK